ncbi:hypothetical protein AAG906_035292 [Vitis piasezkii]
MASSPQSSALHHIRHHLLSDSADSITASTSSPFFNFSLMLHHITPLFLLLNPQIPPSLPISPVAYAAAPGENSQLRSATPTAEGLGFGLAPSTPPSRPPGPTTERPSGCAAAKRSSTSLSKPEHHQRLRSGTPAFGKG